MEFLGQLLVHTLDGADRGRGSMIEWHVKVREFGYAAFVVLILHLVRLAGCWQPAPEPVRTSCRMPSAKRTRTQLIGVWLSGGPTYLSIVFWEVLSCGPEDLLMPRVHVPDVVPRPQLSYDEDCLRTAPYCLKLCVLFSWLYPDRNSICTFSSTSSDVDVMGVLRLLPLSGQGPHG